MPLRSSE